MELSSDQFWALHYQFGLDENTIRKAWADPHSRPILEKWLADTPPIQETPQSRSIVDESPWDFANNTWRQSSFPPGLVAEEGERNDHVRSFQGRPIPDHGQAVAVYRDLSGAPKSGYPARGSWSMKTLSEKGGKSPHVQAHTVGLHIKNARPIFDRAAREFFKEQEKRGVHAYIGGHVHEYHPPRPPEGDDWEPVSYYPDISEFFTKHDRLPYHGSDEFVFAGGQAFARGNIKKGDEAVPLSKFEQPRVSGWVFHGHEPSWTFEGWSWM